MKLQATSWRDAARAFYHTRARGDGRWSCIEDRVSMVMSTMSSVVLEVIYEEMPSDLIDELIGRLMMN